LRAGGAAFLTDRTEPLPRAAATVLRTFRRDSRCFELDWDAIVRPFA
jgi:hypothetical protein